MYIHWGRNDWDHKSADGWNGMGNNGSHRNMADRDDFLRDDHHFVFVRSLTDIDFGCDDNNVSMIQNIDPFESNRLELHCSAPQAYCIQAITLSIGDISKKSHTIPAF